MKTVILHGELGKRFGRTHRFAANSVSEVIRALRANFKDFEEFMCGAHRSGMGFKVFVGANGLSKLDQLENPVSEKNVIRIAPAILGSGGPITRIFIGAVLIGAGALLAPFSAGLSTGLIAAGAGLALGGVASLLTSPPKMQADSQPDKKTSYIFSGPVNSTIQGGAVPVGYGRLIIGSVIISAGIETYEVN